MKRLESLIASALIAFVALFPVSVIFAPSVVTVGCASQKATTFKSLASVQEAVKTSLAAWADYVVKERSNISLIQDQSERAERLMSLERKENKVRSALSLYKSAVESVRLIVKSGSDPAPESVLSASGDLISAVNSNK